MRSRSLRALAALLGLAGAPGLGLAQPFVAGQTYFGPTGETWIEYQAGDLPIILSAPHGGTLEPAVMPDRSGPGIVTVRDTNTEELARALAAEIETRTGRRAHVIISRLARLKLDPNRDLAEGALGDPEAEAAWNAYHGYLAASREAVLASPEGRGFLLDLHGHGHVIQRLELGYDVTETDLLLGDATLRRPYYHSRSSIREVAGRSGTPFIELLRGPQSLGQLLADRGYPAVPSQTTPDQGIGNPYFDGGFITETYTSRADFGRINGVQIETNSTGVRDTGANREAFADALLDALDDYLRAHEGLELGLTPRLAIEWVGDRRAEGQGATLRLRRTGRRDVDLPGTLVLGGTAGGADYSAPSAGFLLPAGTAQLDVAVPLAADLADEGTETLTADVAVGPGIAVDGARPATLFIEDATTVQARVSADSATVAEGGTAVFRVVRTGTDSAQVVGLEAGGDARAGWDYRGLIPTSVAFAAGQAEVVLSVAVTADERRRPDRSLSLAVTAGPGYVAGLPAGAAVALVDVAPAVGAPLFQLGGASGDRARDVAGGAWVTRLPSAALGPVAGGTARRPEWVLDGTEDALLAAPLAATATGAFSVATWFRVDAFTPVAGNVRGLLGWGDWQQPGSLNVYLVESTGRMRTSLRDLDDGLDDAALDNATSLADGAWHHYALVVEAGGTSRVYVDGVLRRTANRGGGAMGDPRHLWIGWREGSATNRHWPGAIADTRWYHRALPAEEVAALAGQVSSWSAWAQARGLGAGAAAAAVDRLGQPLPARFATGQALGAAEAPLALSVEADGTRRFRWLERADATGLVVVPERYSGGAFGPLGGAGSPQASSFVAPGEEWVERTLTFPADAGAELLRLRVTVP